MRAHVNAANLLTSGNLAAGFVAVLLATDGLLGAAAIAVVLAAVLDSLDGLVARRLACGGRFGSQLDSLADLLAFGVAPALMLHEGGLDGIPVAGAGACLAFVLAGAWRLARFGLVEDRRAFVGLPIPPSGLVAAAVAALALPAAVALVVSLVLALAMVSTLRVPTFLGLAELVRAGGRVRAGQDEDGGEDGERRSRRRLPSLRDGRNAAARARARARRRGRRGRRDGAPARVRE